MQNRPVTASDRDCGLNKKKERRQARPGEETVLKAHARRRFGRAVSGLIDRSCGSLPGRPRRPPARREETSTAAHWRDVEPRRVERERIHRVTMHGDVLGKERHGKSRRRRVKVCAPQFALSSFHTAGSATQALAVLGRCHHLGGESLQHAAQFRVTHTFRQSL